jgi:hypothetical protein
MEVYKCQLFSGKNAEAIADAQQRREWCVENNFLAISYTDGSEKSRSVWEKNIAGDNYGRNGKIASKLIDKMESGSLVWTHMKEAGGKYCVGVVGEAHAIWREDLPQALLQSLKERDPKGYTDVTLVRECRWIDVGLSETPGSVVSAIHGRGATLSKVIGDNHFGKDHELTHKTRRALAAYSLRLLNLKYDPSDLEFWTLAHPDDLEDLLALYLQVEKGLLVFPSTAKPSTSAIEYLLVDSKTGKQAAAQCKITDELTAENVKNLSKEYDETYISQPSKEELEKELGKLPSNVVFISRDFLLGWAKLNMTILPGRIQHFIKMSTN